MSLVDTSQILGAHPLSLSKGEGQRSVRAHQVPYQICLFEFGKAILDSPYYVYAALCIVVIVVSLIFKMAYFLS